MEGINNPMGADTIWGRKNNLVMVSGRIYHYLIILVKMIPHSNRQKYSTPEMSQQLLFGTTIISYNHVVLNNPGIISYVISIKIILNQFLILLIINNP